MKQSHNNVSAKELDETTQEDSVRVWRERVLTDEELFHAEDGAGRKGWFLRLSVTGMYPRRIGPFSSKEEALDVLETVAYRFEVEIMTDIQNDLEHTQACVQEGVSLPPTTAPACA